MKTSSGSFWVLILLAGALGCSPTVKQSGTETTQAAVASDATNDSSVTLRESIDSYVEAFNNADAEALANHWTEQGDFTPPSGETIAGRKALEKLFKEYFRVTPKAKLELLETRLEMISPSIVSETGVARVTHPEEEEPSDTEYRAIHVRTADGWKIDSIHEQVNLVSPTHLEHLQDLAWMVGSWADSAENATTTFTCRWAKNKTFLVRTFRVHVEDGVDLEGTQIIGWDSDAQAIRSWLFDSDGGFGAGHWTGGDGRWTVRTLAVLPEGGRASATNVYQLVDENTVQFSSVGRLADGELLPSLPPVTLVRVAY